MALKHTSSLLPLLFAAVLPACSSTPEPPPPLEFNATVQYQANGGRLFYILARSTSEKQFMLEGYPDIAAKAFADPPDPSVLGIFPVVPGEEQTFTIAQPAQGSIALYFLLTQPGPTWKQLLSLPLGEEYDIEVAADGLVRVNQDD